MTSYDEYYKNFLKSSESSLNEGINTATKNAEKSKNIINTKYDGQKQTLQENYDAGVANTNEAYDDAFRKNEIQVKLNERYLERKAAEMGLTDSGLNRTQMTANQLSYANQKGELTRQRQKAIDTLAATMRAKMTDINNNQTADIAEVDMNLNTSIAQMKSDNQKWASEQASEMVKVDKEAETARTKAEQEAINARNSLITPKYEKLLIDIYNEDLSSEQKINAIETFGLVYGFETIEQANDVLERAGLDEDYEYVLKEDGKGYLEKKEKTEENISEKSGKWFEKYLKWNPFH